MGILNPDGMKRVYIGYVVEVIIKNGDPTLELRVRVPTIHGADSKSGIADKDLPIAKPLMIPGVAYNKNLMAAMVAKLSKVFIVFESGDFNSPVYMGIKGNSDLFNIEFTDLLKPDDPLFRVHKPSEFEPSDANEDDVWIKIVS